MVNCWVNAISHQTFPGMQAQIGRFWDNLLCQANQIRISFAGEYLKSSISSWAILSMVYLHFSATRETFSRMGQFLDALLIALIDKILTYEGPYLLDGYDNRSERSRVCTLLSALHRSRLNLEAIPRPAGI